MRRKRLVRLDLLCLGASPEKLAAAEIPAVATDGPLSGKERARLLRLQIQAQYGVIGLTPAERYEREQLLRRAGR